MWTDKSTTINNSIKGQIRVEIKVYERVTPNEFFGKPEVNKITAIKWHSRQRICRKTHAMVRIHAGFLTFLGHCAISQRLHGSGAHPPLHCCSDGLMPILRVLPASAQHLYHSVRGEKGTQTSSLWSCGRKETDPRRCKR